MIAKLTGAIDEVGEDSAIIDVGGVGYLVFCSRRTLSTLSLDHNMVRLLIETHVREDHIHLFGFIDAIEKDWFKLLTTVQGVGAKVALNILSALPPEDLLNTLIAQDRASLAQAQGVGQRLAERIISELKNKYVDLKLPKKTVDETQLRPDSYILPDAISALVNLGYPRNAAFHAAVRAEQNIGKGATVETVVKNALQELST